MLLGFAEVGSHAANGVVNTNLPLLKTAQQVRDLTLDEAQKGYPVHITGVVTYNDGRWQSLFIQDSTAGVYVYPDQQSRNAKVGELIEIDGYTGGEYAPAVHENSSKTIGQALLPEAKPVSADQLMTGSEDSQWVQVDGVVRNLAVAFGRLTIQVVSGGNSFVVHVPDIPAASLPSELLDSKIRVKGVCGSRLSRQDPISGIWLFVPDMNFITVLQPSLKDLFARDVRPIKSVLRFSPRVDDPRRVKVSGVVMLSTRSGKLFIKDDSGSLQLRLPVVEPGRDPQGGYLKRDTPPKVQPGDRIEAIGFPVLGEYGPVLQDVDYRKVGAGSIVKPTRLKPEDVIRGRNDAELVTVDGRVISSELRRVSRNSVDQTFILQGGDQVFDAVLENAPGGEFKVPLNSLLRLTGICTIQADQWRQVRTFHLLLRSPEDIQILSKPPVFGFQDALKGLAVFGIIAAASLVWALTLRREISQRTTELGASEARYRIMTEHAPEAIVILDVDSGHFVEANGNAVRLFGITRGRLMDTGWAELCPPVQADGRPSHEAAKERIEEAANGQAPIFDWTFRGADGKPILTEVRLVRLPAPGRNLIRGSISDITQRRQIEADLAVRVRSSTMAANIALACNRETTLQQMLEECCTALVQHLDLAVAYVWTLNERDNVLELQARGGVCNDPNQSYERIPVGRFEIGQVAVHRKSHVTNSVIGDPSIELQEWVGKEQFVAFAGYPLTVADRLVGVLALYARHPLDQGVLKIMDSLLASLSVGIRRKFAERALRESEERFSRAFRASPAFVSLARLSDGRFLEVNDTFIEFSGFTRQEVIGRSSEDLQIWSNPDERQVFITEVRERGFARGKEITFRPKQGSSIVLLVSAELVDIEEEPCILAVAVDITHKQQAERELLKALAREKELGELKSNFVSLVSHEFRTPLGIILSSAEILETYFERLDSSGREEHLLSIQKSTRRMAELMEEALVIGKMEAGKLDFKPSNLNLRSFFVRLADEVLSATNHRCPIMVEAEAGDDEVPADEALLRHVFTNLLSNAVKYSSAGVPVHLVVERDGEDALVKVRDRGIGIPEADRDRLFRAFNRARNVGQIPGTGLGLVIAKRCVDLHGGEIKVESVTGEGTTFIVRLPVFGRVALPA